MMKKVVTILYLTVVIIMAAATFIEKDKGTDYVTCHIYGVWWYSLLWALLMAAGVAWIVIRKMHRPSVVLLHASFVIILIGAGLTHITGRQGAVHLRKGVPEQQYTDKDSHVHTLPFTLRLDSFAVNYHEGTTAAADYLSYITLSSGEQRLFDVVSINRIVSHQGIRLYQSSYDDDLCGSVLAVNNDPWGIPTTYTGYTLLFIAFIWILFDPRGGYRALLTRLNEKREIKNKRLYTFFAAVWLCFSYATAQPTLPRESADRFGRLAILYNNRVCPVETYALDFTKKLYGHRSYGELSATQVLAGFIFFSNEWSAEPVIKVKSGDLKSTLLLPNYCTLNTFFNPTMGGYILGPYVEEYYRGDHRDGFHRQAAEIDDHLMLIMELQQGTSLRILPYTYKDKTTWYSPIHHPLSTMFSQLNEEVHAGHWEKVDDYLDKLLSYQQTNAGITMPSDIRLKAEHVYNAVPFATILFIMCLSLGFLSLTIEIKKLLSTTHNPLSTVHHQLSTILLLLSFLTLTVCLALRWLISGSVPMSNGYETMLLIAWFVQLVALSLHHRFRILVSFGLLLSGFFLLVSHLSQMDPQIGRLMPVLRSPLLSIHVSIIMMAFALLSLTFISGITALVIRLADKGKEESMVSLAMLSRLFLYPALALLAMGIFIGAVWANLSWGTYWSWDPKETWALITLMVYAVAVHDRSFPSLHCPLTYHLYMVLAFLTILMTYFGVNYLLGGMHSYA